MEKKKWWLSKTFWMTVATVSTAVIDMQGVVIPPAVYAILVTLNILALRLAKTGLK